MTPVFQTIIAKADDPMPGNCMQAAIASLLDLKLEEVPHFLLHGHKWWQVMVDFLGSKGIEYLGVIYNPWMAGHCGEDELRPITKFPSENCGIGGYFYASVYSPKFFDPVEYCKDPFAASTHAVIIDKNFNIVHDPNPNNVGLKEYPMSKGTGGYNGVRSIWMFNDNYGK